MLPSGLAAQPADRADAALLRARHPTAQTVARLLVGACSCDLVRLRHPDALEDERTTASGIAGPAPPGPR